MDNRSSSTGRSVAAFVYFALTTIIAIILLLTAAVVWLSELTGSFIASALIIGGFFAVLSLVIYHLAVRDAMEQIRIQIQTIYEVARLAKSGYEWISEKLLLFMNLRNR